MKKQSHTPANLTNPATNSHLKGLQQYFTPPEWAEALGAALPEHRRTIFDPFSGNGSLLRGLANDTTRDLCALDIDPAASLGPPKSWKNHPAEKALHHQHHGDFLDLLPLLEETATRFDLLAINPPFSLTWPLHLLPDHIRHNIPTDTLSSTHATIRAIPGLLTDRGEAILIANASTIQRLQKSHPADFAHTWLTLHIPNFFPGVDPNLGIAVLYFTGTPRAAHQRHTETIGLPFTPGRLANILDATRATHFTAPYVQEPWNATRDTASAFRHCAQEMERRRNPQAASENILLDDQGRLRIWITGYQERSFSVPKHLTSFLRKINRSYPVELTIQNATRAALKEALDSNLFTIHPAAQQAITDALTTFAQDRAPLAPVSNIQRLGWIDDTETLLCKADFHEFRASTPYRISTQTVDWSKQVLRPRYHNGKRTKEAVLTRGTDLRITLHTDAGATRHFTYNPTNLAQLNSGRDAQLGDNHHTLADLEAHFHIPDVPDITTVHPLRFQQNLDLITQLEASTP